MSSAFNIANLIAFWTLFGQVLLLILLLDSSNLLSICIVSC